MAVKAVPDGYSTISPMLFCDNTDAVLDFVTKAFDTQQLVNIKNRDGSLMAADLRIGSSSISIVKASTDMPATIAVLYLYVEDADATYQRGIQAGGQSLLEPKEQPHGDRMGGFADPAGNQWWIATRIEELTPQELQERMSQHHDTSEAQSS